MSRCNDEVMVCGVGDAIAPGIHTSDVRAIGPLHQQGVRFIAYASDIEFIYNGAQQGVLALQEWQP